MSGRKEHGLLRAGSDVGPDSREPAAVGAAFEQLRAGLHRYLLRHLHRPEDVEDVVQEVYLRLLRFTDHTRVKSPQAYLFRVAFNVLYEFRLHRNRTPVSFDSEAAAVAAATLPDEAAQPEEALELSERADELRGLIAQLPPMQRLVLLLATRENLSHVQIGDKLGISASTARVHLFRAMGRLRSAVAETGSP